MAKSLTTLGRPALIVIDMQRDFVDEGAPIECPGARDLLPRLARLANRARHAGVPVIYTQEAHRAARVDFGRELDYEEPEHCLEGSPGVALCEGLTVGTDDFILVKRRYSSFFATDLDLLLKGLGVDTVLLTGVATDVCVRATAQDAHQLDYRVVVASDGVAGTSVEQHDAALRNIEHVFGHIASLATLEALLGASNTAPSHRR